MQPIGYRELTLKATTTNRNKTQNKKTFKNTFGAENSEPSYFWYSLSFCGCLKSFFVCCCTLEFLQRICGFSYTIATQL